MMSTTVDPGKWKNLSAAMIDLKDLLRCWTCNKVFLEPVSYRCGHFFCADCAKQSGTKCGTCNVPSLASEIRPDRIVSAVVGCFQKLSSIINNGERSEESISCPSTNNGKKSSRSTLYDYQALDDSISSPLDQEKTKISDDTRDNLQNAENENANLNIHTKLPGNSSEKFSRQEINLETEDENFVKPAHVKKPPMKVKKAGGGKKGLAPASTEANKQKDFPGKDSARKKIVMNSSLKSDKGKPERPTPDEFPKDAFVTPKKPRRSNNLSGSKALVSGTPEVDVPIKYTPRKINTPGRELSKKNHKGETPLHVACIKGNVERIRTLLNANATPNTKDNAGWTPLHEAAIRGFTEVVELLLEAGALIDVPGSGNVTPLHEAVIYNHVPVVKYLVAHGADIHARSSEGKTPLDLATSSEMKEALLHTERRDQTATESGQNKGDSIQEEMVLCGESSLTPEERVELCSIAVTRGARLIPVFGPEVTHFIVPSGTDCTCPPSLEVLCAILRGVLILTRDWMTVCKDAVGDVDVDLFELTGINDFKDSEAPKRSRINTQKQYKLQTCELTRSDIMTLVKSGGGIVLTRQPDPEAIPANEKTVPYHAPREGSLTETSHFILYAQGKGEPEMKYNMKHCKTLTVEWFIQCVVNWRLLDP
ncbi:BRCA1-associated RING domain protein 1 [Frankliniella fusca]|uniref:BRCA1-associated RING domain protein 1 n=1 Tax=Frankliniella fusca TaxID=407009 RepID=A0AAE1HW53_9NEOP|nr:BRCA1-associated RING domain protein 1 [Frankliniella fusca]